MDDKNQPLSKYPEGGIKELFTLSFPLMICSLASLMMIFVDRCFLAHYSIAALNASVNAGTLSWAFLGGIGMICAMVQVFVAQYNGAKQYSLISRPVWQMIWFSLLSFLFFIPLGIWGGDFFFFDEYKQLEKNYFQILILFAPFYALMITLSGFYIGRGKTKLILFVALLANIINIFFDWLLIFGCKSIHLTSLGIQGAALATGFGVFLQTVILFIAFSSPRNKSVYNSHNCKIYRDLFLQCCRYGFPQGCFYTIEIVGWVVFFQMMTSLDAQHITVSSICQTIIILFSFFLDGLYRGVSSLAGNFIGSNRLKLVKKTLFSGCQLQILFSLFISYFFFIYPDLLLGFLLPQDIANLSFFNTADLYTSLKFSLICVYIYLFFMGIRWILAGILSAAGDTLFLLISGSLSIWIFFILPVYFFALNPSINISYTWLLSVSYAFLLSSIYYWRYLRGKWKTIHLIGEEDRLIEGKDMGETEERPS